MYHLHLIMSCVIAILVASAAYSDTLFRVDQPSTPGAVTLIYEPDTGNLSLDTGGEFLTSFYIVSQEQILTGTPSSYLAHNHDCIGGFFTVEGDLSCTTGDPSNLFAARLGGASFGNLDLETIVEPQLTAQFLMTDLEVEAFFLGGGEADKFVPTSPHLFIVPEPASMISCLSGVILLLIFGRRFAASHQPRNNCHTY